MGFIPTSDPDSKYNCVAFALNYNYDTWWPEYPHYWPGAPPYPHVIDVQVFIDGFASQGFTPCAGQAVESGYEKIALYTKNGEPRHVARQLPNGKWTSKLGPKIDIEQDSLLDFPPDLFVLAYYGAPTHFFRRKLGVARVDYITRFLRLLRRRLDARI